jgi:hypothetical protein
VTGFAGAVFTEHARRQMARRGIDEAEARLTIETPEWSAEIRPGRLVAQRVFRRGTPPRPYLLMVFVDTDRDPPEIVTGYWTSRIGKYRSSP